MINYLKIKNTRKYLTKEATEILVLSSVISHLDYCNVTLYKKAQSEICKMKQIKNMSAKRVIHQTKFDSSRQALYDLHLLPIDSRISLKLLTFMYKCSVGEAPLYLTELLTKQIPNQKLRSAQSTKGCYVVPFNKRKTFSDRSFWTIGPKLWNNLPAEIRQATCNSIDCFLRPNWKCICSENLIKWQMSSHSLTISGITNNNCRRHWHWALVQGSTKSMSQLYPAVHGGVLRWHRLPSSRARLHSPGRWPHRYGTRRGVHIWQAI